MEFVAGGNPVSANDPEKFYAVAVGSQAGVYMSWPEAQQALKGVAGPKFKKFPTREEAEAYIDACAIKAAEKAAAIAAGESPKKLSSETFASIKPAAPAPATTTTIIESLAKPKEIKFRSSRTEENDKDYVQVWTDGSSLANGRFGASAGIGVWFGPSDER